MWNLLKSRLAFKKKTSFTCKSLKSYVDQECNIFRELFLNKHKLPWLIWTTYFAFSKILEKISENKTENMWSHKVLRGRVLFFFLLFS